MLKKQESKFNNYLDEIVYKNRSSILITTEEDYQTNFEYESLTQEQLEELSYLYAIEDNNRNGDTKDEILGANYNNDVAELVEWIAKMCCEEHYRSNEDCEIIAENISKISAKAFVRFYGNTIEKLYRLAMQKQIETESFLDLNEED